MYELLRVVDSALPVTGKIYYNMFEIQEKIKNLPGITSAQRHELYQSFVNRCAMLHSAHRSSLCRPGIYVNIMAQTVVDWVLKPARAYLSAGSAHSDYVNKVATVN